MSNPIAHTAAGRQPAGGALDVSTQLRCAVALCIDGLQVAAAASLADLRGIDTASLTRLAEESGIGVIDGRLCFDDPIAATNVAAAIEPALRTALHMQLAEAIADTSLDPAGGAAERAWHLAQAGSESQARELWLHAADAHAAAGNATAAVDCLAAAIEYVEVDDPRRLALLEQCAQLASEAGLASASTRWHDLAGEHAANGDIEGEARSLYHLFWAAGDDANARTWLQQAAALGSGKVGWATRAAALIDILDVSYRTAIELDRVALRIARANGDRRLEALALLGISVGGSLVGDMALALQTQRQSITLAIASGDRRSAMIGMMNMAAMLLDDLQPARALVEIDSMIAWIEHNGMARWRAEALAYRAAALSHLGRMKEAALVSADALAIAGESVPRSHAFVLLQRAMLLLETGFGTREEIEAVMAAAAELASNSGAALFEAEAVFARAQLQIAGGELSEALRSAAEVGHADDEPLRGRVALMLVRAGLLHSRPDFIAEADRLIGDLHDLPAVQLGICVREVRVSLEANICGDIEPLRRVVEDWRACGHSANATHALLSIGVILARRGDVAAASAVLREVHAEFIESGCLAQIDHVVGLLGELTAKADGGVRQLTESLLLAGVGERNRELVMSLQGASRYEAGHTFFSPEDQHASVYFLRSGRVRLYCMTEDGKRLTVELLDPGSVFGEGAALGRETSGLYAEADEDVVVGVMPAARFRELISRVPRIGLNLLELVVGRLGQSHALTEQVAFWTVDQRLVQRLLELDARYGHPTLDGARVINEVFTHSQLAELVNARRETVGEVLKQMRGAGLIELRRRRIVLLDLPGLRAMLR